MRHIWVGTWNQCEDRGSGKKYSYIWNKRRVLYMDLWCPHVLTEKNYGHSIFCWGSGEKIKQLTKLPTHLQGRGQQLYKHTRKKERREEGRRKGTKEGNACKRLTSLSTSKHNSRGKATEMLDNGFKLQKKKY